MSYDDIREAHEEVTNLPYGTEIPAETLVNAAAFEGLKAWERVSGDIEPEECRMLLAQIIGMFVDRMVETLHLIHIDKEEVTYLSRQLAVKQVGPLFEDRYNKKL